MEIKFYKCNVCGNIVCKVEDSGMTMMCCGKQMTELRPESTDGELEKHVPIYEIIDNHVIVQVGATEHPMKDYHHIEFIGIETDKGFYVKYLMPALKYPGYERSKCDSIDPNLDDEGCMRPRAKFRLNSGEKLLSIFEYCNLHGMFTQDIR